MAGTGGKRPGAGRKVGSVISLKKRTAAEILAGVNEQAVWLAFVESDDQNIALKAMIYLTDRRDGKPMQPSEHTGAEGGPIQIISSIPRPPKE
jgi:hypothetical protein